MLRATAINTKCQKLGNHSSVWPVVTTKNTCTKTQSNSRKILAKTTKYWFDMLYGTLSSESTGAKRVFC